MRRRRAALVYKKSRLRLAREKHNERIRRLLQSEDPSVRHFVAAAEAHSRSLNQVKDTLVRAGFEVKKVYRARFDGDDDVDLVITIGGDGTLLDASHRVHSKPILGVNSDPGRSVGFLCAAHAANFADVLDDLLAGALRPVRIARLGGTIDEAPLPFPVLNDLLVAHQNPAATSRYLLRVGRREEDHKSSGVWVATAAGSTAACASAGGTVLALDDARYQLRVREPYIADGPPLDFAGLLLKGSAPVTFVSKMREGKIYLDGPHSSRPFPLGAKLQLNARATPLLLVASKEMNERRAGLLAAQPGS